jgi:hypothetical protein
MNFVCIRIFCIKVLNFLFAILDATNNYYVENNEVSWPLGKAGALDSWANPHFMVTSEQ